MPNILFYSILKSSLVAPVATLYKVSNDCRFKVMQTANDMALPHRRLSKLERWTSKFKSSKKGTQKTTLKPDAIETQKPTNLVKKELDPIENETKCCCCGNTLRYPVGVYKVKCLICTTYLSLNDKEESPPITESNECSLLLSYKSFKQALRNDTLFSIQHQAVPELDLLIEKSFSNVAYLNQGFINDKDKNISYNSPNLNFYEIQKFYHKLCKMPSDKSIYKVSRFSLYLLKHPPSKISFDRLNWILIILENPLLNSTLTGSSKRPKKLNEICYDIVKRIMGLLSNLEPEPLTYLLHWWSRLPKVEFENKINLINLYITFHINRLHLHAIYEKLGIRTSPADTENDISYRDNYNMDIRPHYAVQIPISMYTDSWHLKVACQFLSYLKFLNNKYHKVSETLFYNSSIENINMVQDFDIWQLNSKLDRKEKSLETLTTDLLIMDRKKEYLSVSLYNGVYQCPQFTISEYAFLVPLSSKIHILEQDSKKLMNRLAEEALISSMVEGKNKNNDMFLRICVNRDNITKDSLYQIIKKSNDVKKQLKVQFIDEPGIDAGGIKKEWFSLIIDDIFDQKRGLIEYDNEMGYANLSSTSKHYKLIYLLGEIIGMAISNSIILNIKFPRVMYKKLLGYKTEFCDLSEVEPTIHNNLKKILRMDNIAILELTFDITFNGKNFELIPNGKNIRVTAANKYLYVNRYASFLIDDKIKDQFEHFSKGFYNVVGSKAFQMMSPREVQKLIVGDENENMKYDLYLLQTITKYAGCKDTDEVVVWFWEFFDSLEVKKQHKLMKFITGSDMIPALGINSMQFKVTRLQDTSKYSCRLPVSHTCFNEICLWEYKSKEILSSKFILAMNESEGFTLK